MHASPQKVLNRQRAKDIPYSDEPVARVLLAVCWFVLGTCDCRLFDIGQDTNSVCHTVYRRRHKRIMNMWYSAHSLLFPQHNTQHTRRSISNRFSMVVAARTVRHTMRPPTASGVGCARVRRVHRRAGVLLLSVLSVPALFVCEHGLVVYYLHHKCISCVSFFCCRDSLPRLKAIVKKNFIVRHTHTDGCNFGDLLKN